jgi:hypothetical protein
MHLKDVIETDAKQFRFDMYSSCTPLEIYSPSRGYREFQVSALQL